MTAFPERPAGASSGGTVPGGVSSSLPRLAPIPPFGIGPPRNHAEEIAQLLWSLKQEQAQ